MIGIQIALDWRIISAVAFGLLMFGLAYNALVTWLENQKEGFVAFLVVAGVLVTLIGVAIICWQAALLTLACFCLTGLPMTIGDVWRYTKRRGQAEDRIRQRIEEICKSNEQT